MIVIPGAADGLQTCVDVALFLVWFYRRRAQRYRILILSRREPLPERFGFDRHADDMIESAAHLGFGPSVWECPSAAGPIGQWIAVKRPDLARGLILSSSYDYMNDQTRKVLRQWLEIAAHRESLKLFSHTLMQKYQPPADVVREAELSGQANADRPPDPARLRRILEELLQLDQRDLTPKIKCQTLVIAGQEDRVVPGNVQRELAGRIPSSTLELCPGFGHFNDMENPEYQSRVEQFADQILAESQSPRPAR
ncbi:MAG: alpha/beta hydrolase [Planctomycetaceae bacterium]|nr:alpha/beta hydrolase [Planctomycetaceae bacterium]